MKTNNGSSLKQADYRKLSEHIIDIHLAMQAGEGNSVLRDALQDEMTSRWFELNEQQRKRLWGLSADLYMLHGEEVYTPASQCDRSSLASQLALAAKQHDWDSWLELMRVGPRSLAAEEVAFQRGRCWQQLGHDEAALLFYDHAAALDPDHTSARILSLHTLMRLNRMEEAIARANDYIATPDTQPGLLFKSADVLFVSTIELPPNRAMAIFERIVDVIERGLEIHSASKIADEESLKSFAYVELGLCYENLGKNELAKQAYDSALAIDPNHEGALIARGVHQYQSDPKQAVVDFERAARNQSGLVWPYFYLMHHSLVTGNYPKSLASFVRAFEKPKSPLVAAHLLEWSAITQCELLGASKVATAAEDIQFLFQEAMSLSSGNERIRKNFQVFQAVLHHDAQPPSWTMEEPERDEFLRGEFLQAELQAA